MIHFVKGNLLTARAEALVNTVNTNGVMGKGIALQFKERFPLNYKLYADACKKGNVQIGKMFVTRENSLEGLKIIVNFPTKKEWYKGSQYNYVEDGLKDLVKVIYANKIRSIALPPLGCGNGGLNWGKVQLMINEYLKEVSSEVFVYEPNENVKEILQSEGNQKVVKLTPSRAMLLYALAKYEERGENPNVFAANKIAYFLQASGEPLKLQFVPYVYGPYSPSVEKVLYVLNGKYLTGLEQMSAKPFETLQLKYENFKEVYDFVTNKLSKPQKERLAWVLKLIEGFESTLALEILASVHYLLAGNKGITITQLVDRIQSWNNRKRNAIKEEFIQIALRHLQEYGKEENFAWNIPNNVPL